jgi:glycosyltransferase involved in cell wall biosynthesis
MHKVKLSTMKKAAQVVYINGRFLAQPATGVQRFAFELLTALDHAFENGKISSQNIKWVCAVPSQINDEDFPKWKNIQIQKCGRLNGNLWEQIELPFYARKALLINLCNIGPLMHGNQIVVFHDASVFAIPRAYSQTFKLKYRLIFLILARTARQIITVSQFSKKELAHYLKINEDKIIPIPEGCEHILNTAPDLSIMKDERLQNPFLLAVGSSSPHKNISNVVAAIENRHDLSINLVIAGGNFSKVFNPVQKWDSERIIHLGYVNDAELRALYSKAVGFVFPSLYEGFGLPPLEAMRCGCPVICSNQASLPEVCGDAALYFNPQDTQAIGDGIFQLVNNPSLQKTLKQKGVDRANEFTWEKSALCFWKILQKFL